MFHGIPEPPDHLTDVVREIWRSYAPVYGVTVADSPLFEAFCQAFAEWRDAIKHGNDPKRADREFQNFRQSLAQMLRTRVPGISDGQEGNRASIEEQRTSLLAVVEEAIVRGDDAGRDRRDKARVKPKPKVTKKPRANN